MEVIDITEVFRLQSEKQIGVMSAGYGVLLRRLEDSDGLSDEELCTYLRALRRHVTDLDKHHETLITIILDIHWTAREANVVKEYQSFILNLVSAQTHYLSRCVEAILDGLSVYSRTKDKRKRKRGECETSAAKVTIQRSFVYLHQLLQAIVKVVPMTPVILVPLVHSYYPYVKLDCFIIESYVHNILHLCTYMPAHRYELLRLVIERSVYIDAIAPREQVQQAEDDADNDRLSLPEEDLFVVDDVNRIIGNSEQPLVSVSPMSHVEGQKLDCIMDLVFTFIHQTCFSSTNASSNNLNWDSTKNLYRDILQIFDSVLLPTHASCHVQFIMFYICSFHSSLSESFLEHLWRKATDPNVETVFRQAAVAYLSSFLARARYLKTDGIVWIYLERMSDWVQRYIKEASFVSARPDARHHGAFYAVCQALFYIFVFRHQSLLSLPRGIAMAKSLGLANIVSSRLNPLRVCHPTVIDTFTSVARTTHVAFCDTIVEHNRRNMLPEAGSEERFGRQGDGSSGTANPLNLYFPFDPYVLTKSSRFITELYQEYEGPVMNETRGNDADVGDGMEFDEMCTSPTMKNTVGSLGMVGSLGTSVEDNFVEFFKYGRSPGFNRK